jgi:hypothetical protein
LGGDWQERYFSSGGDMNKNDLIELQTIPQNEKWLYQKLVELQEPNFATVFKIVLKAWISLMIIYGILCSFFFLIILIFLGSALGTYTAWIQYIFQQLMPQVVY